MIEIKYKGRTKKAESLEEAIEYLEIKLADIAEKTILEAHQPIFDKYPFLTSVSIGVAGTYPRGCYELTGERITYWDTEYRVEGKKEDEDWSTANFKVLKDHPECTYELCEKIIDELYETPCDPDDDVNNYFKEWEFDGAMELIVKRNNTGIEIDTKEYYC